MDTIRGQNEKLYASIQKKLCFTLQILGHSPHYEKVVKMRNFTLASKKSSVLHCKFLATHRIMKKWSKWETSRRAPKQISVYIIFHCKFWVTHCVRSVKLRNFRQKKVLFILFSTFQFFSLSFYPELGGYTDIVYLRKFLCLATGLFRQTCQNL